jgi:hypothetical protein
LKKASPPSCAPTVSSIAELQNYINEINLTAFSKKGGHTFITRQGYSKHHPMHLIFNSCTSEKQALLPSVEGGKVESHSS